ncbi:hypothetical protein DV737_g1075, partial [Chaetothyriales sp. CBS 132003]
MRPNVFSSHDHEPDQPLPERSDIPPVQAQFFYFSLLSIDDALSPGPPVTADKTHRHPPQPFSIRDNASLEEAWRSYQAAPEPRHGGRSLSRPKSCQMFSFPSFRDIPKSASPPSVSEPNTEDIRDESALPSLRSDNGSTGRLTPLVDPTTEPQPVPGQALQRVRDDTATGPEQDPARDHHQHTLASDISGKPFARAPSQRDTRPARRDVQAHQLDGVDNHVGALSAQESRGRRSTRVSKPVVLVGVSRLHLVEMPDLMMKPIYWSPTNDTSKVIRATWFYKDTMLPVPIEVANLLEIGYEYIKPYLDSYQDELDACVENGASAEMKVVHKLWPDRPTSTANHKTDTDEADPSPPSRVPARYENGAVDPEPAAEKRAFETHSVIYTDGSNAQILRPSLLPSMRQNRRPLSSIRKGQRLGVAVVRGFDMNKWQRLHPRAKPSKMPSHLEAGVDSQSSDSTTAALSEPQNANSKSESPSPVISDLILVIHGIGQKLSEKVDSFHFTYAINDVRRQVNVELASEAIQRTTGQSTGVMLLPVNWRRTMSFDDENNDATEDGPEHRYALTSITPDTLPAVRSIVSDVMLDIPYYMSHHKDKMISAVIREANRIYRLWCANNPGFRENGRVHLIGHSLGSVIAMEILSQQPTRVPDDLRLDDDQPSTTIFEFDTANLFTCGSPCGFFLWLHNNARLIPRKGRSKPGLETEHLSDSIAGHERYGCLAVDNIYNIINRNDPIAYLVNAAVDADYAESLQPANIPSVSPGFWSRVGSTLGWGSVAGAGPYAAKGQADRPQLISMPSTVEMDTHNFTREEIAEKRMYLLNDNGQIDYFLQATGGPLEIQYLSMLSAHSSYWLSHDFIRFLVMEITRKPGKANTFPVLRAVKKREYKKGSLA